MCKVSYEQGQICHFAAAMYGPLRFGILLHLNVPFANSVAVFPKFRVCCGVRHRDTTYDLRRALWVASAGARLTVLTVPDVAMLDYAASHACAVTLVLPPVYWSCP